MARQFNVPDFYRSSLISSVKAARQQSDPRKKDLRPSVLDFGPIKYLIARHFGFCFGVENAIEIAYQAVEENKGKRVFLLSEMIHNPRVNEDLRARGVSFLRTTSGQQLIPFEALNSDDIVIIPAFGTTVEIKEQLKEQGIDVKTYNTTCPFVEKVWKRSNQIGESNHTVVIHGKRYHEETRATLSHASLSAKAVVVRDIEEAAELAEVIRGNRTNEQFYSFFAEKHTQDFLPERDLKRIGVVNQTTMLASETTEIAALLRDAMSDTFGADNIGEHFADTSDTLCYATNENQNATYALLEEEADIALVVGGYNSSNTSHLVELCAEKMPTYFIKDAEEILSQLSIRHFDMAVGKTIVTDDWIPRERPLKIVLTAGASCPDSMLDEVIERINGWSENLLPVEEVLRKFELETA